MTQLQRTNLTDALAREIALQMLRGVWQPGERLPTEHAIAAEQGVSRSVVRESIRSLASKGMIASRPGIGATVQATGNWNMLDPDLMSWALSTPGRGSYLLDLVAFRMIVEPAAAELAAINPDDGARAAVVAAAADMRTHYDDPGKFPHADFEFHRVLFEAAGNPFLTAVFNAISVAFLKSLTWYWDPPGGPLHTVELHEEVASAIEQADAAGAKDAMTRVLENARGLWTQELTKA
ncbi:FadR/GntR family transcriptional regulator [Halovulum sp. GXIMD14794]